MSFLLAKDNSFIIHLLFLVVMALGAFLLVKGLRNMKENREKGLPLGLPLSSICFSLSVMTNMIGMSVGGHFQMWGALASLVLLGLCIFAFSKGRSKTV
jgi:peptidoglycan/LPS O-acetylase OafA/YrhL